MVLYAKNYHWQANSKKAAKIFNSILSNITQMWSLLKENQNLIKRIKILESLIPLKNFFKKGRTFFNNIPVEEQLLTLMFVNRPWNPACSVVVIPLTQLNPSLNFSGFVKMMKWFVGVTLNVIISLDRGSDLTIYVTSARPPRTSCKEINVRQNKRNKQNNYK